jgi:ankyrin repeat protein
MEFHRPSVPVLGITVVIAFFLASSAFATDLHEAVKAKDVARVQALVNAGADPNKRSPYDSPLHVAVRFGPPELVIALLDAGADIELTGYGGIHPLHGAAQAGQNKILSVLLARGARVDALDNVGRTPLMTFVSGAVGDAASLKLLLAAGADPNLVDGATHLYALHYTAMQGRIDETILLVTAGANVNAKDSLYGKSPLHFAMDCHAQRGAQEVVQFLIDHGADVNAKDNNGMTPLQYAKQYAPNYGLLHQTLKTAGAR